MDEKIYFINLNEDLSQLVKVIKNNYNLNEDEAEFLNNDRYIYTTGKFFQIKG